jgi:hypothetical protein
MKRRLIPILPAESLLNMATKQLLGRLHSLQRCEEAAVLSDRTREEISVSEGILFKDSAEWQRAYADLKAVLATREHIPTAAERATARQERAKRKSNKTVQRTGASRFAQVPIQRQRRLAPVADLRSAKKTMKVPDLRSAYDEVGSTETRCSLLAERASGQPGTSSH